MAASSPRNIPHINSSTTRSGVGDTSPVSPMSAHFEPAPTSNNTPATVDPPSATASGGVPSPPSPLPSNTNTQAHSVASNSSSTTSTIPTTLNAAASKANAQATKQVKWGVTWTQPIWMIVFLVCGVLLAAGHHLYYNSLNGSTAGSASRQQWPIRFGTAFAYLATSSLNAAVGIAFTQQLWRSMRQKSYTIDGLDKIFSITTDPTSFASREVLSRTKVVAVLGLLAWTLPLAAIIPPATLTVTTSSVSHIRHMAINVPDWISVRSDTPGSHDVGPLPSDQLLKVALQTGEKSEILPSKPPAINSSYNLPFFGPTVRCSEASYVQRIAFDHYATRILNESGFYVASDVNVSYDSPLPPISPLIYSAFSPRWNELQNNPTVDTTYNNWRAELGAFDSGPWNLTHTLLQQLWVQLANETWVCELANASYNVNVDYINGAQTVTVNDISALPAYNDKTTYLLYGDSNCSLWGSEAECLHTQLSDPQIAYIAWFGALANLLNGNITITPSSESGGAPNVSTRLVQQTGLASCPEISASWWNHYCWTLDANPDMCSLAQDNLTIYFPEVEPWLCRNGSIPRAIEDLANNITISMLSQPFFLTDNTLYKSDPSETPAPSPIVPVTISNSVNVYTYDWRNLVLSYAIAVALSLAAVLAGGVAFRTNGVSHLSSFSAIMATTRNRDLDALAEGQGLGAVPISEDIRKTKLMLGLLDQPCGPSKHAAFGIEGTVKSIVKHVECT